ncbi:hypothetical protein SAMN05216489_09406 [Streptomyces sp. 3213]|nr:hypothetical protein SAMN05216489_09406 [Streptomyces sp. 3213] [Streptomyces sp. 3213.3]
MFFREGSTEITRMSCGIRPQTLEHPQILREFRETDAGVRTRKRERECAFRLSPGKRRTSMREGESP